MKKIIFVAIYQSIAFCINAQQLNNDFTENNTPIFNFCFGFRDITGVQLGSTIKQHHLVTAKFGIAGVTLGKGGARLGIGLQHEYYLLNKKFKSLFTTCAYQYYFSDKKNDSICASDKLNLMTVSYSAVHNCNIGIGYQYITSDRGSLFVVGGYAFHLTPPNFLNPYYQNSNLPVTDSKDLDMLSNKILKGFFINVGIRIFVIHFNGNKINK